MQEVVCERVHALEPRSQRQQGQGYDTGYQRMFLYLRNLKLLSFRSR